MGPVDPTQASKAALRDAMQERRLDLDARDRSRVGEALAAALAEREEWRSAARVALFAGLSDEPDTRPVARVAWAAGKQVFLPKCRPDGGLDLRSVNDWSALRPGRFGILEPGEGAPLGVLADLDLVLLPGVAFDPSGRRLGRGGGFYDRALGSLPESAPPFLVGVGFAFQMVDRVPVHGHDRRVGAMLTDQGWAAAKAPR